MPGSREWGSLRDGRSRRFERLGLLAETPSIVRALTRDLDREDAAGKADPDRFSVAEVVAHMAHAESHCYRARLDRFLSEDLPEFEPDDAQMHLALYRGAGADASLASFEKQRAANVALLRGLPRSAGGHRTLHKAVGEITLRHMLHEWALHDLGHIRQIAELIRARKHWRQAGPLGEDYELNP